AVSAVAKDAVAAAGAAVEAGIVEAGAAGDGAARDRALAGIVAWLPLAEAGELNEALAGTALGSRLWFVSRGAVAVDDTDEPGDLGEAPLWGLAGARVVDLPARGDPRSAAALCGVLAASDGETRLALRPSGVFSRRLRLAPAGTAGAVWRPTGRIVLAGDLAHEPGDIATWVTQRGAAAVGVGDLPAGGPGAGPVTGVVYRPRAGAALPEVVAQ